MSTRENILFFILCTIAIGCSSNSETIYTQKITLDDSGNIGSLQTRNYIIRLETGSKFSVFELSGKPIALSLNKTEFQNKFPKLYKDLETAVAKIAAGDIIIDASMNPTEIQLFECPFRNSK